MALNWVTINEDGKTFLPLEGEEFLFIQNKVQLEIQAGSGYPGSTADNGILYLTNMRIVYITQQPIFKLLSFNIGVENIKDGKFEQPWLKCNYFQCHFIAIQNGGIDQNGELKFYFKDGGGFSFFELFNQLLLRKQELDEAPTHLDPLPRYVNQLNDNNESQDLLSNNSTSAPQYEELPPSYT